MFRKTVRTILIAVLALSMAVLNGCGGGFVDLTEDESRKIVNYSTNVLSDYNTAVKGPLKNLSKTDLRDIVIKDDPGLIKEIEEAKEEALAESEKPAPPKEEPSGSSGEGGDTGETDESNDGVLTIEEAEIASTLGLEGFTVEYGGHDLLDTYPPESSEDMLFSMEPATDKDVLLVLYFDITNLSDEEKECNILELDPKFRFKSSGKTSSFLTTLLLDDLSTYVSTIEPQGKNRAVLVAEISREKAEALSDLTLVIRKGDEEFEVPLES